MTKLQGNVMRWVFILLLACAAFSAQAATDEGSVADARILIDISGSMKKNDPHNLRRPALRLLVGLLPDGARAGVWTFGQYVNMLVPLGQVDKAWKARARAGAAKIGSPGQFTNIEDVIKRSMADWEGAPKKFQRHLILLTDGVVDISKNPARNAASRKRIIQQLLPQLKKHGARVHTIALSERADHALMQTLSGETDGWYEQVNDSAQLQRVFLRIFEKVGRPDTVPLRDNKFQIDSSIQEVTLLIFRSEGADVTQVITPSGKKFGAMGAPENVSWHRDEGYDLLTISAPETGEWRVQAAMDPDNRVMVVTDLKMRSSELPSRFVAGERLAVNVHFTNQSKKITRKDFLDVIALQSEYIDANGAGEAKPLFDDGQGADEKAGDGDFTLQIGEGLAAGKVELIIRAEGSTFQREQRQVFELAQPFELKVTEAGAGDAAQGVEAEVRADAELVDIASLEFKGVLVSVTGQERPVMLLPGNDSGSWTVTVNPGELVGNWMLGIQVSGKTVSDNPLDLEFDPIPITGKAEPPPPEVKEPSKKKVPPKEPEPEGATDSDRGMNIAIIGGANLILLILGGVAFWFFRRRKGGDQMQLVSDEEEASDDSD